VSACCARKTANLPVLLHTEDYLCSPRTAASQLDVKRLDRMQMNGAGLNSGLLQNGERRWHGKRCRATRNEQHRFGFLQHSALAQDDIATSARQGL